MILAVLISFNFVLILQPFASAAPTWPSSWISIDWDRNENGATDDWRDVEYAYYQYDSDYLYLKLHCYDLPGRHWPTQDGRYKWFIDVDGSMYYSGGNVYDAEYVLFVEDTDHDGTGEMYLAFDADGDNNFGEYEPWPPSNYLNFEVTDPNAGDWRIAAPNQIEMSISWVLIGAPSAYQLFWATDQQNPNLDQGPTTDRVDEEEVILVHNVAAITQNPAPSTVIQGEHVFIEVTVENTGTQIETFNVTCYANNTILGTQLVSSLAAGNQAILTYDWNTASTPVGKYAITAWADSSAAIAETNEEDNWCTTPATVTVMPEPVHDVAAISQTPDKTSVVQGTAVNINVTVSNLGNFTETFNVTAFYGSTPIDTQLVTNLALQTSTHTIFVWNTTAVAPGSYYIQAMADSSRNIVEVDEDNNNCTNFAAVTVYSSDDMGALVVDKVRTAVITGEDPPVVGLETVYELTIIVTNIGGSTVTNTNVSEITSSEVTFISIGTPSQGSVMALPPPEILWNVGTLAPGATATLTFRVGTTPHSPGLIYLNHKEDITASGIDSLSCTLVSDVGDTDTTVTAIIRDVAATNQVPSTTTAAQGDTVAIFVTVDNLGNVSETFDVTCHSGISLLGIIRIYGLESNSQTIITFEWDTTGVPPGTYFIAAEADASYEIDESNETNNLCTAPSAIVVVIHDVAIVSQYPWPTTVFQGENVTVEVVVKNEGTETETFDVSCYANETFIETRTVADLAPNATLTLYFAWNTLGVPAGVHFINTQAVPVPNEVDTDDNACWSQTSVTVNLQEYYLTVSSLYGAPGGEGWYIDGSIAYATLNTDIVNHGNGTRRVFVHWDGDASGSNYAQSDSILMDGPKTAVANWKTQYFLTVTSAYGTTGGEGWYDSGATALASVSPLVVAGSTDTQYVFAHWSGDGSGSTSPSDPITMNGPKTAVANWETQYYLTITHTLGGVTNPASSGWYDAGTTVPVTAIPDPGYKLLRWELDDTPNGSNSSYSVLMNSPHTLHAVFDFIVGGSTAVVKLHLTPTWVSINSVLVAAFCVAAFYTKKRRKRV
jgi:hypothetical protein